MGYRYNAITGELNVIASDPVPDDFANQYVTDSGTAIPSVHIINFFGDATQGISSSGAGNTVTYTIDDATETQKGVSELATNAEAIAGTDAARTIVPSSLNAKLGDLTANSVPFGAGSSSAISWTDALTDGQLVIGATGAPPAAANLISSDMTISITNAANSIDLTVSGATASSFPTNSGTAVPSGGALQELGDTAFIVTSGSSNIVTIDITSDFEITGMHGWNGSILESAAVTVTAAGGVITFSVEKAGGGELTVVFSTGYYEWDTDPASTVTLTAGTDTSPVQSYVYLLESTKVLTASTVGWPVTEHARLATVICQSAASLQTDGPYKLHAWTDHVVRSDEMGHLADLNFWIRHQPATWESGVLQTYTITPNGGAPDNVTINTTAGVVLQLHEHTFPAFAGGHDYYVINDNATPYTVVTDLNALLTDSTGASMSGRYFSLVLWGVVSEATGDCKIFVNLPGGSYNNSSSLASDTNKFANFSIPSDYIGTGFLISRWDLRHQVAASGTWTSLDEVDLRGLVPSIAAGGSTSNQVEFPDNTFRIFDDLDITKLIAFQASPITTGTTRTITAANYDIDLATVCISAPTDSGTATPAAGILQILGGAGCATSGATNVVTIDVQGGGIVWNVVTGTTAAMVIDNGYIGNNAAGVTFTFPATAVVGSIFRVTGLQASWTIAQNAGQTVYFGNDATSTGAGGSLASTHARDAIEIVCVVADTDFQVLSSIGNITVT